MSIRWVCELVLIATFLGACLGVSAAELAAHGADLPPIIASGVRG